MLLESPPGRNVLISYESHYMFECPGRAGETSAAPHFADGRVISKAQIAAGRMYMEAR